MNTIYFYDNTLKNPMIFGSEYIQLLENVNSPLIMSKYVNFIMGRTGTEIVERVLSLSVELKHVDGKKVQPVHLLVCHNHIFYIKYGKSHTGKNKIMLGQPARSIMPRNMTAYHMISSLRSLLPGSSSISVAIVPSNNKNAMDSYTKLVVMNTPNGPAIFVGDSPLIPPTSVDALIQVFELPINRSYLNFPVRLLTQKEGFEMHISLPNNQIVLSGPMDTGGKINDQKFTQYGLVNIMNNWTFGTLLFEDLRTRQ